MIKLLTPRFLAAGLGMRSLLAPWSKWAQDLSGTRTQVVVLIVGLWLVVAWRSYTLIKTAADGVALLGAMNAAVMASLAAWLAAKVNDSVREIKLNGQGEKK